MSSGGQLRTDLAALMADEGRPMTLVEPGALSYDPATGTSTAGSPVYHTGAGRLGNYSDALINGTLIKFGDRRCTFVPDESSLTPQIGWSLIVNSAEIYQVVNIKERELGGTIIGFTMQVRSGG